MSFLNFNFFNYEIRSRPISEVSSPSQPFPSSDDIYCNLQNEVDSIDEKIYDAVRYNVEDSEEAQIYDRIVVQREAVEDIWKSFKPECQREHQIKELLDTETNYLKNCLEMLMTDFYTPLKHFMPAHDFKTIFGNIADIYQIHQSFHNNLRRAVLITFGLEQRSVAETDLSIGSVFLKNKTAFLAYADYCAHIKSARECLDELERKEAVTKRKISELTKRQDFSLQDLLSVPFQRICKYHLILKNIVESTDIKDPERLILQRAFEACADVVNYVNEVKRDYELMDVIISIERSIVGIEVGLNLQNILSGVNLFRYNMTIFPFS